MKKYLSLVLAIVLAFSLFAGCTTTPAPTAGGSSTAAPSTATSAPATTPAATALTFKAGTYTATTTAMHGPMTVEVTVSDTAITDVKVTDNVETPSVGEVATIEIPKSILANQSLAVDTITGVTISSMAILRATEDCLTQAAGNIEALNAPLAKAPATDVSETADVIIVGGGGAGLAAAVSASDAGASVILIEKTGFLGGNSVVAGGIYNAPDASLQDNGYQEKRSDSLETLITTALAEKAISAEHQELIDIVKKEYDAYLTSDKTLYDSVNWFALQTWNGGDKLAVLSIVKILTGSSLDALKWMESMGMEFQQKISHGGGSLYPRTHSAVLPNGSGYIKAFNAKLATSTTYKVMMDTTATGLIVEEGKVVGVNATAKDGSKVTLRSNKGVILTTGGFAGNVALRQEYNTSGKWADLSDKVPTSNMPGVTGDGIFFARDAGAELVNMDQIQLLPYCNPINGATYDIVSGSSGGIFVNKEGKRFVREDGRRDEMSNGIIAQTDSMMYMVQTTGGKAPSELVALGGQTLQYFLDTNYGGYVMADTIEELAVKINVPADALKQTVTEYNAFVASGKADTFGRVSYAGTLETGPFYAYPRKPAVHHTMGGVRINETTQALRADGTAIPGLYCAGEITGVVHGSNRLGGNAIVDFVVFGKIAGETAAKG